MAATLIVKTNADGFKYHWAATIYIVEMWDDTYRAVEGDRLVVGRWERITSYWEECQAERCLRNFQNAGCTMRLTIEPQD